MATKIGSFSAKLVNKQTVEVTKQVSDSAKAVFDLAKTIKEKPLDGELLKTVQPYVGQFASLLDVLNSPLGLMVKEMIPFASIGVTLLNLVCEATKNEPTLEECVALVVQEAYLRSVQICCSEDQHLMAQIREVKASETVSKEIQALADKKINDRDAKKAMLCFPESEIAEALNRVLQLRLEESGLAVNQAKLVCDRVSRTVPHVLNEEIAKAAEQIKPLADLYRMGGQAILERFQSLEDYLTREIAPKPIEKVFDEERLTFRDLYVRLKVQLLDSDGKAIGQPPLDLETWTEQQLIDPRESNRVLFIQGEAGRGKSVFCRMFSDRVRRTLYPSFLPIVVRLRHLRALENNLTQTLENYLETWNFVTSDSSWLTDKNVRFLFLLDGFDELLLEGRSSGGLREFLQQVEDFQRNSHHRFLITGRPLSLQGVERLLTQQKSLTRVAIEPMNDELRSRWLRKWGQQFGTDEAETFERFLMKCPNEVKDNLAREPLLLYLLARLHRERRLGSESLTATSEIEARVLIYDEAVKWVLERQREDENLRLIGLKPEELRQVLTEAALCVVQAGNECAPIRMLEARLKQSNNPVSALIEKARKETATTEEKALNSLLTAFYVKPASGDKGGSVEFTHKSFGEFLCAERLKEAIESWTEPGRKRDRFYVPTEQMNREIYDLLGSPVLTLEIVEYLMALLSRSDDFKPVELFERLNEFYELWCEGTFIDAPPENLPQEKMRLLREQSPDQEKPLGIRQVDVYAGLHVMILLLKLHHYARSRDELKEKILFYPSGQLAEGADLTVRLETIISYSDCLISEGFNWVIGAFLISANLPSAYLRGVYLEGADLRQANLSNAWLDRAYLDRAYLHQANLSRASLEESSLWEAIFRNADLSKATLRKAELLKADFSGANLSNANLHSTNLRYAIFYDADLSGADLSSADLSGAVFLSSNLANADLDDIIWDKQTHWEEVQGLETARNTPIALKKQLGLE